jgi:hypothetical protein
LRKGERRLRDAIALKSHNRIPFLSYYHFFATYAGITKEDATHDSDKLAMPRKKVTIDFEPDMDNSLFASIGLGNLLRILEYKQLQWPGGIHPPDRAFQFVEKEYMTEQASRACPREPGANRYCSRKGVAHNL